jgi:NAD(P)-dependent dehydrogenase (short-subunit alcohol dehydrogenase family)
MLTGGNDAQGCPGPVARRLPGGRIGQPEDLANALLFPLANGYVNGATLLVDGGSQLTSPPPYG